jgi:hypothetical protein
MTRAIVTCPATHTPERIELVESPLGPLLRSCTRFSPPSAMSCARACARQLELVTAPADDAAEPELELELELEAMIPEP